MQYCSVQALVICRQIRCGILDLVGKCVDAREAGIDETRPVSRRCGRELVNLSIELWSC